MVFRLLFFVFTSIGILCSLLVDKFFISRFPAWQQKRWYLISLIVFFAVSSSFYISLSVKKVVNTVFDREISQGGLSSDIDGIPIIPDIESNNDFSYTSNLYFGIAGVLSRILIDSMLEFSGEYGIIPSVDTNISPQLWRVQMLRSFFNRTIVLVQIFLCLLAIIFTAYCIYHSAIWRDKII